MPVLQHPTTSSFRSTQLELKVAHRKWQRLIKIVDKFRLSEYKYREVNALDLFEARLHNYLAMEESAFELYQEYLDLALVGN